jgi:beta-arrestin
MASKVEVPYSDVRKEKKKEGGTRVFKKASPNGKITVYVGKRDFVDHVSEVDPIDGVILIDPSYFEKEGKTTRKVFVQLLAGFRYGREDLDVLGLSFRRDLVDERMVVYPPLEEAKPQLVTMLQLRLLKKLGNNAYPFTFTLKPGLPSSVTLQPAVNAESEKPCGVDFILRAYVAKEAADKIEKRNSVKLAIKKITHAAPAKTTRPTVDVSKNFMLSAHPMTVEANLDKGTYYHGEPINVNVAVANASSKTLKKIKITVRQFSDICLFAQTKYKTVVAELESEESCPVHSGGTLQRTYKLTPLMEDNRSKCGLALDGQIKHEDTCLASSTILPEGMEENKETREQLGIMVQYTVKIRCVVSFGSDVTLELPFTLTHPEPQEKVVCGMVTLSHDKKNEKSEKKEVSPEEPDMENQSSGTVISTFTF